MMRELQAMSFRFKACVDGIGLYGEKVVGFIDVLYELKLDLP